MRHVPNVYVKAKLEIVVNPYRAPDIDILTTDDQDKPLTLTVSPLAKVDGEFFETAATIGEAIQSMPDSPVDIARKTILKQAYNATTQAQAEAAAKRHKPAYLGQFNPMADAQQGYIPEFLPRAGEPLVTEQPRRELAPLNHVEAAKQIKSLLEAQGFNNLWSASSYQYLVKTYPQSVPFDAVQTVAQTLINNHTTQTTVPFLRVINQ